MLSVGRDATEEEYRFGKEREMGLFRAKEEMGVMEGNEVRSASKVKLNFRASFREKVKGFLFPRSVETIQVSLRFLTSSEQGKRRQR